MPIQHTSAMLSSDETALYCCSAKCYTDLQQMLNEDLAGVAGWLSDHKLTLNKANSKFIIIGSSLRLKSLEKFTAVKTL